MSIPSQLSLSNTRGTSVVKKYFSKFTMLIIAALAIAGVVLSFLSGAMASSFLSFILSAAVAVMLTMIYLTSRGGGGNPTIFFGVLQALSIVELVGVILGSLAVVLGSFFLIASANTILSFIFNNPDDPSAQTLAQTISSITKIDFSQGQEAVQTQLDEQKIVLLIFMIIMIVIAVVVSIYISSQTTFLSSCRKSSKGTAVYYDGASSYGTLSIIVGIIYLVMIVVAFLFSKSDETIEGLTDETSSLTALAVTPMALISSIISGVSILVRGYFAKGWVNWAKENQAWVEDGNTARNTGPASSNAMNTFKSTQRKSNDAIHQSQAYTYGTDDDKKDTHKKSEYIPEELQNDYPPQYDQNMGGMMNDPFMGDPFAQPVPQNPYGQDPFAADPFAADPFAQPPMGGNPYGDPNPNDQGYNNGMM